MILNEDIQNFIEIRFKPTFSFRRLKYNQNKSNVAHCPEVATVETLKIVAVGQSKRESSSKIQTVFKRSKSPKFKNKRIPEVLYHTIYIYIYIYNIWSY